MRGVLWVVACTWLAVQTAAAVEVRLRDGTVLTAEEVRVTGSYVMLELADGSRVAYDVADVDLEALERATAESAPEAGPPVERGDRLSEGRSLKNPSNVDREPPSGLAITDREVRHVRGSGVRGDDEMEENPPGSEAGGEVPEGYREGGSVLVNDLRVEALDEGRWRVSGEIVNRHAEPVLDVSVRLERPPLPGDEPWRVKIPLSSTLDVNQSAVFEHEFEAELPEGRNRPDIRATAVWTQRGGAPPAPSRPTPAPPAPSNLGSSVLPTPTPIQ